MNDLLLRRVKRWTGLDRAIGFTVLARLWSAIAGVVTILLIAHFLTPAEQGYYYTFFSFVALQVVFELGFCFVLLQLAAHERASLQIADDGSVSGDPAALRRLAVVLQNAMRWYLVVAALMFIVLLPSGLAFFETLHRSGPGAEWKSPWCLLVCATTITFPLNPLCAFAEGCGFVPEMAFMRLLQALLGSGLSWTAMATHHGLFSPGLQIGANAAVQLAVLCRPRFRRLLLGMLRHSGPADCLVWRRDVWPFQWRIAITWLTTYFISQIFNPIMFAFQGPVVAGRVGMSLSIASSIGSIGLAWMTTKAAPFGTMIARKDHHSLDRLFFRTLWQSTVLVASLAAGFLLCFVVATHFLPRIAFRVVSPWALALLLLTMVMTHIASSEALYMRAHKREPLLLQGLVVSTLLVIVTLFLARASGAGAVIIAYSLIGGALSLGWTSWIFQNTRAAWRMQAQSVALVVSGEPRPAG